MDFDWKDTLKKVAPLAATMIGGPWGGLAASAIGSIFGSEEAPDEHQMAQMINKATPEQLVALKQIDSDLRVKLRELDIKEDQLVYDDKNSARDMQKATMSNMPAVLSILLSVGFFGSLYALSYIEVPEGNKAIVYSMVGSLGTCWLAAMQFYFGTTKASGDKTALLSKK